MSVEIITFKKLGLFPVYLASFFFSSTPRPVHEQCSNLSLENPNPKNRSQNSPSRRRRKSSVLLVENTEIECRQRTGRGRMPRLEPRQSLEKSSIGPIGPLVYWVRYLVVLLNVVPPEDVFYLHYVR